MVKMLFVVFFRVFLYFILFLLGFFVSKQGLFSLEGGFECGMNVITMVGFPFSYQFFVVSVLFLIFDVEVSIVIPVVLEKVIVFNLNNIQVVFFFLFFRVLYEWKGGKVEWNSWMIWLFCN